jgi:preprotein translocase subunit SecA
MRLFGSDRSSSTWRRWGWKRAGTGASAFEPLDRAGQKRVEQHNFQIRKRTLEYDDVMNKQREVIYGFRNEIIHAEDVRDRLMDIMEEVVVQKVEQFSLPLRIIASESAWNFRLGEPQLSAWDGPKRKSPRPPSRD